MTSTQYLTRGLAAIVIYAVVAGIANSISGADQNRDIDIVRAQSASPIPLHTYMPAPIIVHTANGPRVFFEGDTLPIPPTSKPTHQTKKNRPIHHQTHPRTHPKVRNHTSVVRTTHPGPAETDAFFVKGM